MNAENSENTLELIKKLLKHVSTGSDFYKKKYSKLRINTDEINSIEDFRRLPFTEKEELRNAYPLGLQSVPDEKIVRIHSSSGTTSYNFV